MANQPELRATNPAASGPVGGLVAVLDLPLDTELWRQLTRLETQISAELNRLEAFSDAKAIRLQQLRAAKDAVVKLLGFVVDKGIGGAIGVDGWNH